MFDQALYFTFTQTNVIKTERVIGLDFVRATAILSVVFAHSLCFLSRLGNVPVVGEKITYLIDHILTLSVIGVELFFVLSGFLIGNILIRTFLKTDFSFAEVRQFWIRRWFRTLPNYWLIFTADILLYQALRLNDFHARDLLGYVFLQNLWYPNLLEFFPEGWSLSVEEWFYLTLPVVVYVAARISAPRDKGNFLLKIFMGYLLVFVIARFVNAFHPINGDDPDDGIRKVVLFRLDAVMYGVLFAYLNHFKVEMLNRIKKHLFVVCLITVPVLSYFIRAYQLAFLSSPYPALRFASNAFLFLLLPVLLSLCLPFANSVKTVKSKRLSGAVQHVSKISYSMYLVHYSLVFIPFFNVMKVSSQGLVVVWYIGYWVIVVVLSSVIYKYFEYPVMQLRERTKNRKNQ